MFLLLKTHMVVSSSPAPLPADKLFFRLTDKFTGSLVLESQFLKTTNSSLTYFFLNLKFYSYLSHFNSLFFLKVKLFYSAIQSRKFMPYVYIALYFNYLLNSYLTLSFLLEDIIASWSFRYRKSRVTSLF